MSRYILALDEGTTSTRAILFDGMCRVVSVAQYEFTQIFPHAGWVEHDAAEIYAKQYSAILECIAKSDVSPKDIAGIGITNQRETTVVWNRHTGKPVYNAIVWQCRRTAPICEQLEREGMGEYISARTGLRIDAYFSGTKIKWILDNVEGARESAEKGDLLFGTIDTWLLWNLTDGKVHMTDRTNASRTMLYDIEKDCWDGRILNALGIPASMLPEVRSSSEIYGYAEIMGEKIPISGIAGDQQAALFGQGCFDAGDIKNTYGTGCFLLANTGTRMIRSNYGLLTTAAATEQGKPPEYALEGSVFVGGAVIQWLRDELKIIDNAAESEKCANEVPDCGGVYIVPAFAGLGAPYWDMNARGTIVGITRGTNRNHIVRAAVESIAYQTDDLVKALETDMGAKISRLKVDGGATRNRFLMQFQADISDITVECAMSPEATAMGAAFLAGLAVGEYKDRQDIREKLEVGARYCSGMDAEQRNILKAGWKRAVASCREY